MENWLQNQSSNQENLTHSPIKMIKSLNIINKPKVNINNNIKLCFNCGLKMYRSWLKMNYLCIRLIYVTDLLFIYIF